MSINFTISQKQRLKELNVKEKILDKNFETLLQREKHYKSVEKKLIRETKKEINNLLQNKHQPISNIIEGKMVEWLTKKEKFTQVNTPIIISSEMIKKMNIGQNHPLNSQIFWLDEKRCLRPMHAPNLYTMMRDINKTTKKPVRIFEVGPCFRKETQGSQHMNEFTMLNLVELGTVKDGQQLQRLKELAVSAMKSIGIEEFELKIENSEVYGETLDIIHNDIELASGAYGPHPLDGNWGIFDIWVGIGFGIDRLSMIKREYSNIKRVGRSLSYLDGSRLNI